MAFPSATHDMLPRGASANVFVIGPDSLDKLPFRPSLHYNLPWLQPGRVRALSFVIANRQGRCVFLDLGLRENWSLPPPPRVVTEIHNDEPSIRHELNATSEYSGGPPREIDFTSTNLSILGQKAFDYFGDGSLYLLHTPGHAAGHMAALVRLTSGPDSFALLDGDACDHCGELHPSPSQPNPTSASSCIEQFLDINPSAGLQPLFHVMQDSNFATHCHDLKRRSKLASASKNLAPLKTSTSI